MIKFGENILTADQAVSLMYRDDFVPDDHRYDAKETEKYNNAVLDLYLDMPLLAGEITGSMEDYDNDNQNEWRMPDEYRNMDIVSHLVALCGDDDVRLNRVRYEISAYRKKNLISMLRFIKYMVDVMRDNGVVWGVGRGSSSSSYVLYLLGLHKIDSLKYNLDFDDFIRINK